MSEPVIAYYHNHQRYYFKHHDKEKYREMGVTIGREKKSVVMIYCGMKNTHYINLHITYKMDNENVIELENRAKNRFQVQKKQNHFFFSRL